MCSPRRCAAEATGDSFRVGPIITISIALSVRYYNPAALMSSRSTSPSPSASKIRKQSKDVTGEPGPAGSISGPEKQSRMLKNLHPRSKSGQWIELQRSPPHNGLHSDSPPNRGLHGAEAMQASTLKLVKHSGLHSGSQAARVQMLAGHTVGLHCCGHPAAHGVQPTAHGVPPHWVAQAGLPKQPAAHSCAVLQSGSPQIFCGLQKPPAAASGTWSSVSDDAESLRISARFLPSVATPVRMLAPRTCETSTRPRRLTKTASRNGMTPSFRDYCRRPNSPAMTCASMGLVSSELNFEPARKNTRV